MFTDYKNQIDNIIKETEKEEKTRTCEEIAKVTMHKLIVGLISKYVEAEAKNDPDFDAALSLEWKNAGRMLKYIWKKAEKFAVRTGNVAMSCLTEETVYAWVNEYYFLDDKEEFEKEQEEQRLAEQRRKEQKEKLAAKNKSKKKKAQAAKDTAVKFCGNDTQNETDNEHEDSTTKIIDGQMNLFNLV